jgi:Tol biopolymer transport system component
MSVVVASVAMLTSAGLVATAAVAKTPGANGRIVFFRHNADDRGKTTLDTINPDGTALRFLFAGAEHPRWSPDGTQVAADCDNCGEALILDAGTGRARVLPPADPTLNLDCPMAWSPDGTRLACESLDNADPARDGIYTVRSSDGAGLRRVTWFGGVPGDFSPDGARLSFIGGDTDGNLRVYVVTLADGAVTALTPPDLAVPDDNAAGWSPNGEWILFNARPTPNSRRAIWVVRPDGSGLRQLSIRDCGGDRSDPRSVGCGWPVWSPDGTKLAFIRISAKTHQKNLYTVRPDGTDLFEVTHTGPQEMAPDWGSHPLDRP